MCIQFNPKELIALYEHLNGKRMRPKMKDNIARKVKNEINRMHEYKKQLLEVTNLGKEG